VSATIIARDTRGIVTMVTVFAEFVGLLTPQNGHALSVARMWRSQLTQEINRSATHDRYCLKKITMTSDYFFILA
jgi:hypothetical protein